MRQNATAKNKRFVSLSALAICLGAWASTAQAGDSIVAGQLFDNGLKELDAGNYAKACEDFAASQKADPSVGALINLGKCNEKQGKLASAWAAWKDAISLAHKLDDKRADDAAALVAQVQPKLSTLKVTTKTPVQGLAISRDGVDTPGALNVDLPIDPGEHTIEASAPGYKSVSLKVNIGAQSDKQTIEIPALQVDPNGGSGGGGGSSGDTKGGGSGLMTAGFVVGGIGAAGMVVGAIFGGLAVGAKSDVDTKCPNSTCSTQEGKDALSTAKTDANVATGGLIAGGVLLAGGVVMVVIGATSSKKKAAPTTGSWMVLPVASPEMTGAVLGGTF